MLNTIRAVIRARRIELPEEVEIPAGTEMLVMPLIDEPSFWLSASESSLDAVWGNAADDVYAELVER